MILPNSNTHDKTNAGEFRERKKCFCLVSRVISEYTSIINIIRKVTLLLMLRD
jgi:hypothetical protein